jgi:hypothetical protein
MRLNRQDKWFKEILGVGNGYAGEKSRFLCGYAAIAGRTGGSAARDTQNAPKGEGEEHVIQTYVRFSHKLPFKDMMALVLVYVAPKTEQVNAISYSSSEVY